MRPSEVWSAHALCSLRADEVQVVEHLCGRLVPCLASRHFPRTGACAAAPLGLIAGITDLGKPVVQRQVLGPGGGTRRSAMRLSGVGRLLSRRGCGERGQRQRASQNMDSHRGLLASRRHCSSAAQGPRDRENCVPAPRGDGHTDDLFELPEVRDRFHFAPAHAQNNPAVDTDNFQEPRRRPAA